MADFLFFVDQKSDFTGMSAPSRGKRAPAMNQKSVMRDPYTVLGVNRKASPLDVKSAFRNLAKQYHPDVAGDSGLIANTFQEINAAYDILGDLAKRSQFDSGEIDANGLPIMRRQNSRSANARTKQREARSDHKSAADAWAARARAGGDHSKPQKKQGEDFKAYSWGRQEAASEKSGEERARRPRADEVFNDLFAGLKAKAQEAAKSTTRSEAQASADATAKPEPKTQVNPKPQAGPKPQPEPADVSTPQDSRYNLSISFEESARGTSRRVKLPSGKRLDVKIPAGVKSGQQIRLKGHGKSGAASDAILEINVEPHRHFTCEGDDIYLILPVAVDEAVLGARVMVPTLDGPVAMTIPPGSNADTALRLKGRGLPRAPKGEEKLYGDQYVTLKIILPSANDQDFKDMVERWSARNAYDVRSDFMF